MRVIGRIAHIETVIGAHAQRQRGHASRLACTHNRYVSHDAGFRWLPYEWETTRLAVLEALGRSEEAQSFRWACFERSLRADHLRAYLKRLPDFDDIEAEQRALGFVIGVEDPPMQPPMQPIRANIRLGLLDNIVFAEVRSGGA